MDVKGKNVLVFGSGISGISASRLLLREGAVVTLYDANEALDPIELENQVLQDLTNQKIEIVLGAFPENLLSGLSLTVLSPGVPTDLPEIKKMQDLQIPVWGEVELAYQFGKGEVLAVTGTNGKTTTTTLLGEIMKEALPQVLVVGNIGNPYTEIALGLKDNSVVVAEVSSFQLETIDQFHPKVSAILNLTEDHMNRHHTMEAYREAKKRITKNQTKEDTCVLNYEDEATYEIGKEILATPFYFSSRRKLDRGIFLQDGKIFYADPDPVLICNVDELQILGTHNYENVMAASAMALSYGVDVETIRKVLLSFKGVEHRIEFVAEKKGVAYYNDSKGTNPDAAIKGIQAMNRPTVLIGGGYDKESSYEEWIEAFDGKVKTLVLIGETRDKIRETAEKLGFTDTILADSFEEAFEISTRIASPGDAVLLSPACASWDMFTNYEERGDRFKDYVNQLSEE